MAEGEEGRDRDGEPAAGCGRAGEDAGGGTEFGVGPGVVADLRLER
ncbi:hypothetical protein J7E99_27200 [Streptomyces sp. ISL-44]|nr:hypothetical protein [Streptomyces sp. ISL-44]MBT2544290.1 hypothetical protein [Streptomyces sp. ISL-44]